MKMRKPTLALLMATALSTAGMAYAGPPVTVTFKHVGSTGSAAATYSTVTSNETSTYANATPKPATNVTAGSTNTYTVQSTISPDTNYAVARYKISSKTCIFSTTYVNTLVLAA